MIAAGNPRDVSVAAARARLRASCRESGKPAPSTKDVAGIIKKFKRQPGERTTDYLETALAAARNKLHPRDFAAIHQAARSRAGGLASGRLRTTVEKGLLLGPQRLTKGELDDAMGRAELAAAADLRLGVETGGEYLAQLFWAENLRRQAFAKASQTQKSEPGPSDVHVSTTIGAKNKTRKDGLPGGVGDKTKPSDVDPHQLKAGIREEMEHTRDPAIAKEIALDHLTEDPTYYTTHKADRSADPGVMIALRLPAATANAIAVADGEPADKLHVTLAYLGRMSKLGPESLMMAADAVGQVTSTPVLRGVLSGIGRFAATESSDGKDVLVRMVDVPGLGDMRAKLCAALDARGIDYGRVHDFTPHLTLAYVDPKKAMALRSSLQDVYFDAVVLSVNDADTTFPLGQPDQLAEARASAEEAQRGETPTVSVEEVTTAGEARVRACDGGDLMDMVTMSDIEAGDTVEIGVDATGSFHVKPSVVVTSSTNEAITKSAEVMRDRAKHETVVPFTGPDDARIVFVAGAPNELELARGEPLVGPDGAEFVKRYLTPLGLSRSDIVIGFACPVLPRAPVNTEGLDRNRFGGYELTREQIEPWRDHLMSELEKWPNAEVVAVGKAAVETLGDRALLWLPHPSAVRVNKEMALKGLSNGERYDQQIERKIKRLRKVLDDGFAVVETKSARAGQPDILAGRMAELTSGSGRVLARVTKAAQDKQIVYGVVLDPYEIDTQDEWSPPAMIEETAHGYLRKSRVVGREHTRKATAEVVESWVEQYPTPEDYKAAMSLQPHRAYVRPFGSDKVHSGSWVMGVHLGDAEWDAYKRGEITGFSIGGFSAKVTVNKQAMPKVEFVTLAAQEGARG
jgi:uracil-DNA glycosylase family 4